MAQGNATKINFRFTYGLNVRNFMIRGGGMSKTIKIGCCGFPRARQVYYSSFDLVEVQKTFYSLPKPETVQKWRQEAPSHFEFTLKGWQGITHLVTSPTYRKIRHKIPETRQSRYGHFQNTEEVFLAWNATAKIAQTLDASIVVLQCPPNFSENRQALKNLRGFFSRIEKNGLKIAIEFRAAWREETIRDLCQEFDLIHCVDPFKEQSQTEKIAYFRLHGKPPGTKMYRYTFSDDDLRRLFTWMDNTEQNYVLFNNVTMWQDALRCKTFFMGEI